MFVETETTRYGEVIVTDTERPDVRYTVGQDDVCESPNEWGSGHVYVYRTAYLSGSSDIPDDELSRVFFEVLDRHDDDIALEVTRRYARVFLGMTEGEAASRIDTYSALGYSQSDWWDVLSIVPEGSAIDYARAWEQWACGDVYAVTEETRIPCDSPECHGGDEAHWKANDSLGGIYADSVTDAVTEYREVM